MEKKLFLSDEPIGELTEDAFGYKSFVETLYQCIKDCDCGINIGLFGRWGVGKTSIINLLIRKFETDYQEIKCFLFDSWKYSHGSLRQELVLRLNKEYGILNQEKLEREIYSIQEQEAPPVEEGWKNRLRRVWGRTKILFITALSILALLLILYFLQLISIDIYTWVLLVLIFPMLVQLVKEINSAASSMDKTRVLPAKLDPGRLEDLFNQIVAGIVKKNKADKLVIVIDNLDRCSGDAAIEMLEAIKTFMGHDRCVYLLPCDNRALINHLVSVRGYQEKDAREFLRKFFQTSLTVPSLLDQDLEEFANNLLSGLQIPYSQEVLEVIVSAFTENPRQIKQFLNNLTTQYIAAQKREAAGIIGEGEVSKSDGFLAKLLVIRQEYPSFYQELELKEDLLEVAESYFRGGGDPLTYERYDQEQNQMVKGSLFSDNPGLEQFLRSTRTITARDISPFLKLNKETYPSTIPDAQEFKLQVNRGNVEYMLVNLDKMEQEEEKKDYIRRIVRVIDREHIAKHWNWVFNGVDILIKIYGRIPVALRPEITTKIGSLMTLADIRGDLGKFDYAKTFSVLRDMEETYRSHILEEYTVSLSTAPISQPLIDQIIEVYGLMPKIAIDRLNSKLIGAYGEDRERAGTVIRKLNEKSEVSDKLISEGLIATIEQSVDTSVTDENKKAINLYLELRGRSSAQTRLVFLEKLLSIVSTNKDSVYDETKQFGLQNLSALEKTDIPDNGIDELYNTLNEFTGLMSPPNEKLQFIKVFFRFFGLFPESGQEEFLRNHLMPLIGSGDANILTDILAIAKEFDVAVLAYDFLLDRFTDRVRTNLPDLGLIVSITRNTPEKDKEKVKDMIMSLINNPDAQYHNNGLESIKQLYSEFKSSQIGEICDACLQRGASVGKPEKQKFINPILEAFDKCPAQFKRKFADFTSVFIKDGDNDIRDMGINCFKKIEAFIEDDSKEAIINQLLQAVEQRANQNAINEGSEPILDLIIAGQAILARNDKIRLVDTLLGLRNEANPKEVRLIGLKYLGKVDKLYQRKKLTISTLQADLGSKDQDISERAKEALESLTVSTKKSRDSSPSAEASPNES